MCNGHLSQVVLTQLLFGKSIALVICRRKLCTSSIHIHTRRHLLMLLIVIPIWILLQLPVLWYTVTIATNIITIGTVSDVGGLIVPGNVRPHGTDRAETVTKGNFQFALDSRLGVVTFGRILEGTSVNVDGRLGALAWLP